MNKWIVLIVGAACVLSVSSDAKEIESPIATADDVGFGYGRASLQKYHLVDAEKCWKLKQLGFVTAFGSSSKAKRIPAARRIEIEAYTNHDSRSMSGFCTNRIAFTPNAGGHYSIKQVAIVGEYCRMEVIDTSTGRAPVDLEHVAPGSCKKPEKKKGA